MTTPTTTPTPEEKQARLDRRNARILASLTRAGDRRSARAAKAATFERATFLTRRVTPKETP